MNNAGHPSWLVSVLIGAWVAWRLYRRIRRSVGRQRFSNVRPWITVCVFPLLIVLLSVSSIAQPLALLALVSGSLVGVGLGVYGLRLTRFEQSTEGLHYTPSAHLGIGLSILLIARLGYRALQMYQSSGLPSGPPMLQASTPLTLLIFGALAGYYVTYAVGLLRWRHSLAGVAATTAVANSNQTAP